MALIHSNITVGTTPTALVTIPNGVGYVAVQIQNRDSVAIYVGDSAVTAASGANGGHTVAATTGSLQIWMHGNETIYAVSAAGTSTGAVSVIYSA
jgi:phosphoglycolate phosphatase-like HAD superfamily hydrolase